MSTFGTGTFGSGTFGDPTGAPTAVTATKATTWAVQATIAQTQGVTWTTLHIASKSSDATWTTRASVSANTGSVTWNVIATVSTASAINWQVNSLTQTSSLVDTFDGPSLGAHWTTSSSAVIESGRLRLNSASNSNVKTSFVYDFTGSYIQAKVDVSGVNSSSTVHLKLEYQSGNTTKFYSMRYFNGTLAYLQDNALQDTITYDSANHLYWRVRESGGTVYWDTSANGAAWINRWSSSHSTTLTSSRIVLQTSSGSGYAYFDDLNVGGFGTLIVQSSKAVTWNVELYVPPTKTQSIIWMTRETMAALHDNFDSGSFQPFWQTIEGATIEDGRAKLTVSSGTTNVLARLRTDDLYDLNWSSVSAKVTVPSVREPGFRQYMSLFSQTQADLGVAPFEMGIENGDRINFGSEGGAPIPSSVVYDSVQMAYWRLREAAGVFYWDTSPDGVNWTNQANKVITVVRPEGYQLEFATDSTGTGGSRSDYPGHVTYIDDVQGVATGKVLPPATSAPTWTVRSQVISERSTAWNTKATIAKTNAVTWYTLETAAQTNAVSWTQRALVAQTASTAWNVIATISATRAINWTVGLVVLNTTAPTWTVREQISASTATTWTTRQFITSSDSTSWTTLVSVNSSAAVTWTAREAVTTTRATSWTTLQALSYEQQILWTTRNLVYSTNSVSWTQLAGVTSTNATSWTTLQRISSSNATDWTARQLVDAYGSVTWGATVLTGSSQAVSWVTRAAVVNAQPVSWLSLGAVGTSSSASWTVKQAVTASTATTWSTSATIVSTKVVQWTVGLVVLSTKSITWTVRATTSSSDAITWTIRSSVSTSNAVTWNVAAPAFLYSNTFNSGTGSVTTSNSATNGTAFSTVSSPLAPTYTTTRSHGAKGALASLDATTKDAYVTWTVPDDNQSTVYTRHYFRYPTLQNSALTERLVARGSTAIAWITGTGKIGVTGATGTYTLSTNTWYRIETETTLSGTTAKLYALDDSTPLDTITGSSSVSNISGSYSIGVRQYQGNTATNGAYTQYFDEPAIGNTTWIGPLSGAITQVTNSAAVTWNVLTPVTNSRSTTWTTTSTVATSKQASWIVLSVVSSSSFISWSARATVDTYRSIAWSSLTSTGASLNTSWTVREGITQSGQAIGWLVRAQVIRSNAISWTVRSELPSVAVPVSWTVRANVFNERLVYWQDAVVVSTSKQVSWNAALQAVKEQAVTWTTRAYLSREQSTEWLVGALAAASAQVLWTVISTPTATAEVSWRAYAPVVHPIDFGSSASISGEPVVAVTRDGGKVVLLDADTADVRR